MEGRKTVKYKLKAGESIEAGPVEIELKKHRRGEKGSGDTAEILIHAPDDVLVHRVKKRSAPDSGK